MRLGSEVGLFSDKLFTRVSYATADGAEVPD